MFSGFAYCLVTIHQAGPEFSLTTYMTLHQHWLCLCYQHLRHGIPLEEEMMLFLCRRRVERGWLLHGYDLMICIGY